MLTIRNLKDINNMFFGDSILVDSFGVSRINMSNYCINPDGTCSVELEVAGFKKEELNIEVDDTNNSVCVSGKKKTNNKERVINNSFTIPLGYCGQDVTASLEDGLLNLVFQKQEKVAPKAKKVLIK
jgi:HSP20 family molecular chaperone IbpA